VEQGLMDATDPTPNERLHTAKVGRQAATECVPLLEATTGTGSASITAESIARVTVALREALRSDDPPFRKGLSEAIRRRGHCQ